MKNIYTKLLLIFTCSLLLASCTKDKCTKTYSFFLPVYKTPAEVRANIKSNSPRQVVHPGKLFIFGSYIFLNEIDRGIHVIDNTNPSAPQNVSFIDIPGNLDIAVKGNTLYADIYTDLLTLDITNPRQVVVKKIVDRVFPFRNYSNGFRSDSTRIIVDWIKKDTTVTVDCNERGNDFIWRNCPNCAFSLDATSGGNKTGSPFGAGGSMARFAIMNNYLYSVTNTDLNVFNIAQPADPQLTGRVSIGWNIETIFPFKDRLFIGSNAGTFIYGVQNPSMPNKLSQFTHARVCDPVIADDKNAFVTLRSGNACPGDINRMDVVNIENLASPSFLKSYPMTNPHGLSKDGNILFVCDGKDGLKIYNAADPNNIKLQKQIKNIETYDVIAYNKLALVVTKDGLYQFDYSNVDNVKLLSKIGYKN